uniref:Uncharacterized protein n=1 Tax=Mycena chlorophos TaxID=658473 RepID=A0ABQ0LJ57_MYCCL|nr:predicted protein [Mycena chlorophos]
MIQETHADRGELIPAKLDHEKFVVPEEEGDQTLKGAPRGPVALDPDSPQITQEQLQEIMENLMSDKIGELLKQLNGGR